MCCEAPGYQPPPPPPKVPAMLRTWRVELDLDVMNDTGEIMGARFVKGLNVKNLMSAQENRRRSGGG